MKCKEVPRVVMFIETKSEMVVARDLGQEVIRRIMDVRWSVVLIIILWIHSSGFIR